MSLRRCSDRLERHHYQAYELEAANAVRISVGWRFSTIRSVFRCEKNKMNIGFDSPTPLALSQVSQTTTFKTVSPLIFHGVKPDGSPITIDVPIGTSTNLASVPLVASWLVPKLTGAAAAVVHDYCYGVLCPSGELTYREADYLLEQMLHCLKVPAPIRWLMWAAVRWYSITRKPGGAVGMREDLPRLLAVSLPALWLVVPARHLVRPMVVFAGLNRVAQRVERSRPARR